MKTQSYFRYIVKNKKIGESMLKKSLLFVGLLFVSPIFADDLEYDYVSQKVKPDYIQPFKRFEFRFGVGYDINFSTYNNKKINYHNSEVSGLD
ncbi:hypothetical protein HCCG_02089 [Helicobacter cinaedi CCUG 18818 = ATCC BAA-847]|uniref:Outer membrane protein n=2 Tax=Helicobacter cinaedi CCUG 18818 = ATCC BAA-847 TaxID=537971 RepID=A0ABN0BDC0_9HELI|nr:hypothetical protein HCCG_02089 [Helicobacter cinaedi CCUG 18818 = ATCC BAA-847]BBB20212.1 hypothetical protein HC081234_13890 [Helicobacter cinaedi]